MQIYPDPQQYKHNFHAKKTTVTDRILIALKRKIIIPVVSLGVYLLFFTAVIIPLWQIYYWVRADVWVHVSTAQALFWLNLSASLNRWLVYGGTWKGVHLILMYFPASLTLLILSGCLASSLDSDFLKENH